MMLFAPKSPLMGPTVSLIYLVLGYLIRLGLLAALTSGPVLGQKKPLPNGLSQNSPQLIIPQPCKMANGVDMRPFACEFRFEKLEIYGKTGTLLATVDHKHSTVSLPHNQAKAVPSPGIITYLARAYFTRINPPAFPVEKGYLLQRSAGVMGTMYDDVTTLLTGIAIATKVGSHKVVGFNLTWPHNPDGTALFSVHIENDVTRNHFAPKPGTALFMQDISEATMVVNPNIVRR